MSKFQNSLDCNIEESAFHTFGCLVYVMDSKAEPASSTGQPKWNPNGHHHGIYVGHTQSHADSVAMVLNPNTGHDSLQFYVVFDDDFNTVPFLRSHLELQMSRQMVQDKS
jgi:hypothetical protein